jgi:hypothetical protein
LPSVRELQEEIERETAIIKIQLEKQSSVSINSKQKNDK